jgi:hypothetical protein
MHLTDVDETYRRNSTHLLLVNRVVDKTCHIEKMSHSLSFVVLHRESLAIVSLSMRVPAVTFPRFHKSCAGSSVD